MRCQSQFHGAIGCQSLLAPVWALHDSAVGRQGVIDIAIHLQFHSPRQGQDRIVFLLRQCLGGRGGFSTGNHGFDGQRQQPVSHGCRIRQDQWQRGRKNPSRLGRMLLLAGHADRSPQGNFIAARQMWIIDRTRIIDPAGQQGRDGTKPGRIRRICKGRVFLRGNLQYRLRLNREAQGNHRLRCGQALAPPRPRRRDSGIRHLGLHPEL